MNLNKYCLVLSHRSPGEPANQSSILSDPSSLTSQHKVFSFISMARGRNSLQSPWLNKYIYLEMTHHFHSRFTGQIVSLGVGIKMTTIHPHHKLKEKTRNTRESLKVYHIGDDKSCSWGIHELFNYLEQVLLN